MTALVDQMGDRVMPYLKLDATWKTRVTTALKRQAPQTQDESQQKRLIGALENLRKQHLWGDLSDERYKLERRSLERQLKLVAIPTHPTELPNLERSAKLLEDLPVLWSHPGVTHEQREELVREVFHRITIDGKEFMSIEPRAPYAPLFASIVTSEELGIGSPTLLQLPIPYFYYLPGSGSPESSLGCRNWPMWLRLSGRGDGEESKSAWNAGICVGGSIGSWV